MIQVASCPTIVAAANESNQTNNISGLQQICLPWMTLQNGKGGCTVVKKLIQVQGYS